jgi:very-short-patch-repair endonuclease
MQFLPETDPRRAVWGQCESPIEQYLCVALFALLGCRAKFGSFSPARLWRLAEMAGDAPACFLFAQHWIGTYRADFLLVCVNPETRTHRKLIIECDGKAYHAGDEQIARDLSRDDEIERAGYRVMRYPGVALFRRMLEVIDEIKEWIEQSGVVCSAPVDLSGYAWLLLRATPDREVYRERQKERDAYWQMLREKDNELMDAEAGWRWKDTL